jgi:uncharacterized protein (DUF983 family)
MSEDRALYPPQNPVANGMRGICPRCGQGSLFDGFLTLAPRCEACGWTFLSPIRPTGRRFSLS